MADIDFERLAKLSGIPAGSPYGFDIDNDRVFFMHDSSIASLVSESGTGRRSNYYASDPPDIVCVAGDFNNWMQERMGRAPRNSSQFGLWLPLSEIRRGRGQFKFVIDGSLWVEPPAFANNTVDAGVDDPNSRNLVVFS